MLQFASGRCRKLRGLSIIKKCCSPDYKILSFHSLQGITTPVTHCLRSQREGEGYLDDISFSFPFERYITKCVNCYKISQESSAFNDCGVLERSVGSIVAL